MIFITIFSSRLVFAKRLAFLATAVFTLLFSAEIWAHPMPNSVVLLDLKSDGVSAELQLPLSELELAFGHQVNDQNSATLVKRLGPQLKAYLFSHIHPESTDHQQWKVTVGDLSVQPVEQSPSGPYRELTVHLQMLPPSGKSTRNFILNYDVIVHQLVTHVTLVSVRQDWDNAQYSGHPVQVGVVRLDVVNNVIPPLVINQAEGSLWTGFKSMIGLGMQHISEGTDHLLFLLVLLLPAPLLVVRKYYRMHQGAKYREEVTMPSYNILPLEQEPDLMIIKRWGKYGGLQHSLLHILQVVTAFTIGHSITLALGVLGWIHAPAQAIEVLIAISILISAMHALYPIFPHRETYIAAGFGLIHGMAFAGTLANLDLETSRLVLSILGFNIGIELMQLLVIVMIIPWLILLSRLPVYKVIRISGAIFAGTAAVAWIVERASGHTNPVSSLIVNITGYAPYLMLLLIVITVVSYVLHHNSYKKRPYKSSISLNSGFINDRNRSKLIKQKKIKTFSGWPPLP